MKLPPGDTYADHYCTTCGAPFFGPPCGCDTPVTCANCGNEPDACECECEDCGTPLGYDETRTGLSKPLCETCLFGRL